MHIAVIIPALNEEKTVANVVRAARRSQQVDEVIVVSDGSTDQTPAQAQKAGARVITHAESLGKGAALQTGVSATDADILVFLDADLVGLTTEHVEYLLDPIQTGISDMQVGLRDKGPIVTELQAYFPLLSGQRALKREILERTPPEFLQGYMIETALNRFSRTHGYRIGLTPLPGLKILRKDQKTGPASALVDYIGMWTQVVKANAAISVAKWQGKF